ncbi:MAG: FecR domain-containing protein [Planctomycetota bacterium]
MSRQAPETRLIELIVRTRLDTPSLDDVAELQLLLQDPRLRRLYVELINVQGHLESVHTRQVEQAGDDRLAEVSSEDIFLALRQTEEDAPVVRYPKFEWEPDPSDAKQQADGLTLRATASAASYLVRTQIMKHRLMIGSVAAMLMVGAVFALVLMSGPDETRPTPNTAVAPAGQADKPVVATLTEVNEARWRDTAGAVTPRVGDQLHAGHELTLTHGLATITTKRGAIAIIEAPATIELIDHDNAIRLQHGKLLGICETPSSKGFLVRTPHMDITDLGTRFGVDANHLVSEVHVFEGSVQATQPGVTSTNHILVAGQALQADVQWDRVTAIELERSRFVFASIREALDPPVDAAAAGITHMAGDILWSTADATRIPGKQWPFHPKAVMHQELLGHRLGSDIDVTFHLPGVYSQFDPDTASSTIPSGTVIRSYLIAFKAEGPGWQSSKGRITFDGEILGIIANTHAGQSFSDAMQNKPDPIIRLLDGSLESGSYDPNTVNNVDMVEIGQDRRMLKFALQGVTHVDFFRVLVREPTGEQP